VVGVVGDVTHHSLDGYPPWIDGVHLFRLSKQWSALGAPSNPRFSLRLAGFKLEKFKRLFDDDFLTWW